ncbi:TonB-dependent receptor plug domain-containing protein [Muriicola sp.]|uniref:TonB-dependent receptor plug domain-containing protein n=2 Tax=Muriicola sp. TaxID=2020856 RepID=UPI0035621F74
MILNKNYFLIIFLLAGQVFLRSQERMRTDSIPTENLEEVVVTATRTLRQLSSLPLPVTLISRRQLQQTGVIRLDEILDEQTGILMTPDATIGGGEGVQIQGISSDYIMVLIDGVPVVGRSSGNLDLSRLAIGNIQQVEIVKGPSSSLFGSEALGGVINIITEKPDSEDISGQVSHRSATFNNQNTSVNLNQRRGKLGYSLFADRLSTDGYDLAPLQDGQTINPFYNYTINGRVFLEASEKWDIFASARYFFQEFDVSPDSSEETDTNLHLRVTQNPGTKSNLQYEVYFTRYTTNEQIEDPVNSDTLIENDFDQRLLRPEIRYNYTFGPGNTLSLGAGYNFETLDRSLFREQVSFESQYLFAQYDFKPAEKLNIIAGARFDHHSEYNAQLSPKLSVRYDINPALAVKGSIGSGFKAPDFRQLYLDFSNVAGGGYSVFGKEVESEGIERLRENDELASLQVDASELGDPLDAESSVGYNLGITYKKGGLSAEINLFRNDFRNLIDTRILATKNNGQNVFGYINRERVFTQGLETDLKVRLLDNLELSAGYQLLFAYDKDRLEDIENGEVFARDPQTLETVRLDRSGYFGLENRSRHAFNVKLFGEIPKWKANANLRAVYRGRFGITDRNGNGLLDVLDDSFVQGYTLVNLSFGKRLFEHYSVQIGANNVFNFQGNNPLAAQDGEVLINPGTEIFAKINFQF